MLSRDIRRGTTQLKNILYYTSLEEFVVEKWQTKQLTNLIIVDEFQTNLYTVQAEAEHTSDVFKLVRQVQTNKAIIKIKTKSDVK